jgi:hypothetical protein
MPESIQTQEARCTAFACCFGRKTRKEPSEWARTTTGSTGRRRRGSQSVSASKSSICRSRRTLSATWCNYASCMDLSAAARAIVTGAATGAAMQKAQKRGGNRPCTSVPDITATGARRMQRDPLQAEHTIPSSRNEHPVS